MATVQVSRLIPAQAADVWRTLTSREGMKAYMLGADVQTDWRVGGPITMRGEYDGKAFEDRGEVRSFEPQRCLSYTHRSSGAPGGEHLVTFELAPEEGGALVTVTQASADGAEHPSDTEHRAQYEKTWAMMLEGLEKAVVR
ncbi:SRPBCC domain-containing protein [Phenylobacterium hankyongense]|uniref:SRPBCC domain-containing protein n=1 Tax=Phenylobacterium hankyongense TaxID=1813876 RepID=A0A328B4W2_9CAUL|nr:SRPBCC domain-containing protein [Phenylobacterium hankyongense]RAK60078.1 SRPBCC domain-containing protein [Phenylobacterium hankyongense]